MKYKNIKHNGIMTQKNVEKKIKIKIKTVSDSRLYEVIFF